MDKKRGFVNGQEVVVKFFRKDTIFCHTKNGTVLTVYPLVTQEKKNIYPIQPFYASTIYKIQGMTLPHVTVWFDGMASPGTAYVAISRIKHSDNLLFLRKPRQGDFIPVSI